MKKLLSLLCLVSLLMGRESLRVEPLLRKQHRHSATSHSGQAITERITITTSGNRILERSQN